MEFRVLGPLDVLEGGRRLELGGPQQRTLLAHLILRANELVTTDRLIDALWGDDPPATARGSLQSYMSRLRRTLGDGRLEGRSGGYVLHATDAEVDASRFEVLLDGARRATRADPASATPLYREAMDLWRGPALDDLAGQPSLLTDRERLDELRAGASEEKIQAELATGAHAELIPELEELTARHPLREVLWADLMIALYRSGRQADALAAFQQVRRTLADDLGIDPSPDLQRLHDQILAHDSSLAPTGRPLRGYRVHHELGHGAFGVVHRATQPQVGRDVAVKVIRPELANQPDFIRAFEVEAQLVAQLEHPNIVPLYDYWREPAGAYLVMRYLAGGSLRDRLDAGMEVDLVAMLDDIGGALGFAHRRGVVHGDVKMANILFDEDGNAFLSDFGIAHDETGVAIAGSSSPEGLRGEPLTPRTDVYCLALVVQELVGAMRSRSSDLSAVLQRATAPDPGARHTTVEELTAAIRDAVRADPSPTAPVDVPNPFKGLRPFVEADAADFFGREEFVARLVKRLQGTAPDRFLAVVGPSGAGKSSVVRAGLVPALRGGALPGSESWVHVDMVPGADPFAQLESALRRVARTPRPEPLDAAVAAAPGSLTDLLAQALDGAPALLLVDQFEELFTLVEDEDVRGRFIDEILHAAADPDHTLWLVATLRADQLDDLLRHPRLAELLQRHTEFAVPLRPFEVARVVTGPVERVGGMVEAELVARVTGDFVHAPGALPLLQFTLTELFERSEDAVLSAADYDAMGGLAATLARRADTTLDGLDAAARDATRQLLLRVVTVGESGTSTRRRTGLSALRALADPIAMEAAIEAFGAARLLTFDRDPETREPTAEVAHEALLVHWATAAAWIEAARDELRVHQRLARATRDWLDAGHDESYLATGANLEQFQEWRQTTSLALTPDERSFLDASDESHDRDQWERQARQEHQRALERRSVRRLRALVALALVAALVAAGLWVFEGREARIARAGELLAHADNALDEDPELSLLLAIEAYDHVGVAHPEVGHHMASLLHAAIAAHRLEQRMPIGGLLAASAGGEWILTLPPESSDDGMPALRNAATGDVAWSLPANREEAPITAGAVTPNGSAVVTGDADGLVRTWDTRTGEEISRLRGPAAEVTGASITADGRLAVATWATAGEGTVVVWDAASGAVVTALPAIDTIEGNVLHRRVTFSPDGSRLAVAYRDASLVHVHDTQSWDLAFELAIDRWTTAGGGTGLGDVAWSPDGSWLAVSARTTTIHDARTGARQRELAAPTMRDGRLAWSPDGGSLAVGSWLRDSRTHVWRVADDGVLVDDPQPEVLGSTGQPVLAFTSDGDRLLEGHLLADDVQVWNLAPGGTAEVAVLPGETEWQGGLDWSPDGRSLAASSGDGMLTSWDAATWEAQRTIEVHEPLPHDFVYGQVPAVINLDWSPDGTKVATAGLDKVAVWDPRDGRELLRVGAGGPASVAFSPDSALLVIVWVDDGLIHVVDLEGEVVARADIGQVIEDVRFSPDGRYVAAAVVDDGVKIWDWERDVFVSTLASTPATSHWDQEGTRLLVAQQGEQVAATWDTAGLRDPASMPQVMQPADGHLVTFEGHTAWIQEAVWSADETLVATCAGDGTARLWNAKTGRQLQLLMTEGISGFCRLRFSPDGRRIAISDAHLGVVVLSLDVEELVSIARSRITREWATHECREYLDLDTCPT